MLARSLFALGFALSCCGTDLDRRIDAIADASGPAGRGFFGISVIQLSSGKVLYRRNDDRLLLPASNMKILTSALALTRLGADYSFTTKVMLQPSGDLAIIGSGDPSISGRAFPYDKDGGAPHSLAAMEDFADQMVRNGITKINGDVIGDDRLYPWAPYAPSWTLDDEVREFGAPVSALSINENTLMLLIQPGARVGDAAKISLTPPLEYFAIDNRITTVGAQVVPAIRISRPHGVRQIELWGSVPAGHATIGETIAIDDPALYAATALYDALTRRGVAITGGPAARHRAAFEDNETPAGTVVAFRTSPPVGALLQVMDKISQNLFAELMLREAGRVARHSGTREAGIEELNALLAETGAGKDDARVEDGSGLARNVMVAPRLLTRVLVYMHSLPKYREDWIALLPVGGEDGTLKRRFANTPGIRAKTGSLARAISLAGYAESKTYGRVAFSIMVNDFAAPQSDVRAWVDKIALTLLE